MAPSRLLVLALLSRMVAFSRASVADCGGASCESHVDNGSSMLALKTKQAKRKINALDPPPDMEESESHENDDEVAIPDGGSMDGETPAMVQSVVKEEDRAMLVDGDASYYNKDNWEYCLDADWIDSSNYYKYVRGNPVIGVRCSGINCEKKQLIFCQKWQGTYWPRVGAFYMTNEATVNGGFATSGSPFNHCGALEYKHMDLLVGMGCMGDQCSRTFAYCGNFYDDSFALNHNDCQWTNKGTTGDDMWCPADYVATDHWYKGTNAQYMWLRCCRLTVV